ncbi:MAG: MOSC domain-containing protein [Pseudomonadota bacterium]
MLNIARLYRHPIKALGPETLNFTDILAGQTIPLDRRWAIKHDAAKPINGWAPCANFNRGASSPRLMAVTTKAETTTNAAPRFRFSHPDLPNITVNPDTEGTRLVEWVRPICDPGRAAPVQVIRASGQGMTDAPFPSISLANFATLRAVEGRAGHTLDPRRFRANIWFDGGGPWQEFEWLGNELVIGGVLFEVCERITRCKATHVDPDTGRRDTDTLRVLENGWGHQDFGVYAVAVTDGRIAVGDPLEVM